MSKNDKTSKTARVMNLLSKKPDPAAPQEEAAPASGSAPAAPPAPAPAPADPPPKAITLEAVRAVLAERSHDGYTDQVRGLLQKYGAEKLSGVDPKHYAALLKDAEVLGHAT